MAIGDSAELVDFPAPGELLTLEVERFTNTAADAQLVVFSQLLPVAIEPDNHFRAERVARLGAVDGHNTHVTAAFERDGGHGIFPLWFQESQRPIGEPHSSFISFCIPSIFLNEYG